MRNTSKSVECLKPTPSPASNDNGSAAERLELMTFEDPRRLAMIIALGVTGGLRYLQEVTGRQLSAPSVADPDRSQRSDVMTADEVAEYLGVDRNTVYEYAARGEIPHRRLGKRMIFRRGAIIAWLDTAAAGSER
ncbi:MAG: helix-turn-helix domain-containing protein [Kofleriaceae bacterium]